VSFNPPEGYRKQCGCWSCRHCLDQSCQDGESFRCVFGKPSPPKVLCPPEVTYEQHVVQTDAYVDWEMKNEIPSVDRNGICPQWDKKR
jgi:hypothetical protein